MLEQSNYSNPQMNPKDKVSEKQKRLDRTLLHVIVISGQTHEFDCLNNFIVACRSRRNISWGPL